MEPTDDDDLLEWSPEQDDAHFDEWAGIREQLQNATETQRDMARRWMEVEALREHYSEFSDFLYDCMTELMGFTCSPTQLDIGEFLQYPPNGTKYTMIQAQRSQAKSTIVAIFAVWCLIHDCKHRILIISAGSEVATEIANWVIQIIMNWDILECMRPDRQHGDRASTKAFDINWMLKGAEKSPSIACIGITANMQGRRADLLIPDDIESSKNGLTELQRQQLLHLSKDFTSICQKGRICYLGTPQTNDSIYNSLPGRGYTIRIWPGRFPTLEEESNYGEHLAPFIRNQMEADPSLRTGGGLCGTKGKPTDPVLLPEELLVSKELDQGPAYFQLQHMLNTKLADDARFPLKTKNLVVMALNPDRAPSEIVWMPDPNKKFEPQGYTGAPELYYPFSYGTDTYKYESRYMYVDTAGGGANGDETVAWALYFLHGYIFAMEMLPLPGGYAPEVFQALSEFALKHKVNEIGCEQNHGYGAFAQMWRPVIQKLYQEREGCQAPMIVDDWVSQQKELRIIDTLDPIVAQHKLIINESVFETDVQTVKDYPLDKRALYTFVHQFTKITRERNCLAHDDRLDGMAGGVRRFVEVMAVDEAKRVAENQSNQNVEMMAEWSDTFMNKNKSSGNALANAGLRRRLHRKR